MNLLLLQSNEASSFLTIELADFYIDAIGLTMALVGAVATLVAAWNRRPKTSQHYLESRVFPDRYRPALIIGVVLLLTGLAVLVIRLDILLVSL